MKNKHLLIAASLTAALLTAGCGAAETGSMQDIGASAGTEAAGFHAAETPAVSISEIGAVPQASGLPLFTDSVYSSEQAGENALLQEGSSLELTRVSIRKTGDAADPDAVRLTGENAAVLAKDAALRLKNGTILTDAVGADGISVIGSEAALELTDTGIATLQEKSAALSILAGANGKADGSNAVTSAEDSPCVYLDGTFEAKGSKFRAEQDSCLVLLSGSEASFEGCELIGDHAIRYRGAGNGRPGKITLSNSLFATSDETPIMMQSGSLSVQMIKQQLSGNIAVGAGTLDMALSEGSVFCGVVQAEDPRLVTVTLDETSIWTVTEETTIGALVDADASLANIVSNGFTVYYDSSLEANAWLAGKTMMLTGGGFLIPLI